VVITGVSGSGKSTLAFDLLFAEGQRRFLDSMNVYAGNSSSKLSRPDVDSDYRDSTHSQHRAAQ